MRFWLSKASGFLSIHNNYSNIEVSFSNVLSIWCQGIRDINENIFWFMNSPGRKNNRIL